MVNMNKFRDPCIYALVDDAGVPFYVGRTKTNAQNRLWEHAYRANSGHQAPVYLRMREIGVQNVSFLILHRIVDGDDEKHIEAGLIKQLIDSGVPIVNVYGRDGIPDSWPSERREAGIPSRRGKTTWINGKTGEDAGWTEERRKAQSERIRKANMGRVN